MDVNVCDNTGMYLINYAVANNLETIVRMLIKKDVQLDVIDGDGKSILFLPIMLGYTDMCRLLLEFSPSSHPIVNVVDNYGAVPLFYTIKYKNPTMFAMLLSVERAKIDHQSPTGSTILHKICKMNPELAIRFLTIFFEKTEGRTDICDVLRKVNRNGDTCLHCLVANNIMFHLSPFECVIDTPNNQLLTPLLQLLQQKPMNRMIVQKLIAASKTPNSCNSVGMTALHVSIRKKYFDIVSVLLQRRPEINVFDTQGDTAGHYLFRYATVVDLNMLSSKELEYIGSEIDWNCLNADGHTPLHYVSLDATKINWFLENHHLWKTSIQTQVNEYQFLFEDERIKSRLDRTSVPKFGNERELLQDIVSNDQMNSETDHNSVWTGSWLDILFGYQLMRDSLDRTRTPIDYLEFEDLFVNRSRARLFADKKLETSSNGPLNIDIFIFGKHLNAIEFPPEALARLRNDWEQRTGDLCMIVTIYENYTTSHANLLIFDSMKDQVVRFEPHGAVIDVFRSGIHQLIERYVVDLLQTKRPIRFIIPGHRKQNLGLQTLEVNESTNRRLTDPAGFCGAWAIFYVFLKYSKHIGRGAQFIHCVRSNKLSFKIIIREFSRLITHRRDKFLASVNSSIDRLVYSKSDIQNPLFLTTLKRYLYPTMSMETKAATVATKATKATKEATKAATKAAVKKQKG